MQINRTQSHFYTLQNILAPTPIHRRQIENGTSGQSRI